MLKLQEGRFLRSAVDPFARVEEFLVMPLSALRRACRIHDGVKVTVQPSSVVSALGSGPGHMGVRCLSRTLVTAEHKRPLNMVRFSGLMLLNLTIVVEGALFLSAVSSTAQARGKRKQCFFWSSWQQQPLRFAMM
jgi:hypothetical protein